MLPKSRNITGINTHVTMLGWSLSTKEDWDYFFIRGWSYTNFIKNNSKMRLI
jgi:hypothetical protein